MKNADWVLQGTRNGLFEIFPTRFSDLGVELASCINPATGISTWGDDCTGVIATYKTAYGIPTPLYTKLESAVDVNITCFEQNDAGLAKKVGVVNCALMKL